MRLVKTAIPAMALALLSGCQTTEDEPVLVFQQPAYTDFQWAMMAQNSLFMVQKGGYLWPAYAGDNAMLESLPPKVKATFYHGEEQLAYPVTEIESPLSMSNESFVAETANGDKWQAAAAFELDGTTFRVKNRSGDEWQPVAPESVRFRKR